MDQNVLSPRPPSLAALFFSFLRLGATAFGGPAMVAYIRRLAVERKRWLTDAVFADGVALCQLIPGATAMQTAAYVGFRTRGIRGALASFVGFGFAAFVFMLALAALYTRIYDLPRVVAVFHGLRVIVITIMAGATLTMARVSFKSWRGVVSAALAAALFWIRVNPVPVILISAILGLLLYRSLPLDVAPPGEAPPPRKVWPLAVVAGLAAAAFVIPLVLPDGLPALAALMVRVDLFAFGGGFTAVPLMFHEIVGVRRWLDAATFMNGIAMGQVTPGPIYITATFIGYLLGGPLAAAVATVAVFTSSFLVLVGTVPYYDALRRSRWFSRALRGVRNSFVGLLLAVTVRFAWGIPWEPWRVGIAVCAFVALLLRAPLPLVVLAGTVLAAFVL